MSISPEGRGWLCRRNRTEHRGKSPVRLIRALISCTHEEALRLVGSPTLPGAGSVLSQVEELLGAGPAREDEALREITEPREFKKFSGLPSARPYFRYMAARGFPREFVRRAGVEMGLRYCTRGAFAGRVVFLVRQGGRLVNWTGRSISTHARLRYRALSPDLEVAERDGLPVAAAPIERCLLWHDDLEAGGDQLILVEGPMDALKLRMLGLSATCLFTNAPSRWQVDLLRGLAPRFARRVVLLDRGAEAQALRATQELAALGFRMAWLPPGVGDPGELEPGHRGRLENL